MKKEYTLIENEQYRLTILLDETDFDYYTDLCIKLIFDRKHIVLFKDNLIALKNIVEQFEGEIRILDDSLDEKSLGVLLNEYYRCINEDQIQDNIVFDNQGHWIGEKFYYFSSLEYVTWIYIYDASIIMKVTPIFRGFEKDNYFKEYNKFIKEYKDVFTEIISLQQLRYVKKIILELYDELF